MESTESFPLDKVITSLIADYWKKPSISWKVDGEIKNADSTSVSPKQVKIRIYYTIGSYINCICAFYLIWNKDFPNMLSITEYQRKCSCAMLLCERHSVANRWSCLSRNYTSIIENRSSMAMYIMPSTYLIWNAGKLGVCVYGNFDKFEECYEGLDARQVLDVFQEIVKYYYHNDPYGRSHDCHLPNFL